MHQIIANERFVFLLEWQHLDLYRNSARLRCLWYALRKIVRWVCISGSSYIWEALRQKWDFIWEISQPALDRSLTTGPWGNDLISGEVLENKQQFLIFIAVCLGSFSPVCITTVGLLGGSGYSPSWGGLTIISRRAHLDEGILRLDKINTA